MHHFQTHPHHWLPIGSERGVLPTFHRAGTFANFLQTWRRHQKPMIDHHSLYSLNYKKEMVWSLSQNSVPLQPPGSEVSSHNWGPLSSFLSSSLPFRCV